MNTRIDSHLAGPRLLYDRKGAATQLSISIRSLDYLIATRKLATRRLGKKVMVSHGTLVQFARADHFDDMASQATDEPVVKDQDKAA
jgi:hypothetical protein